MSRWPAPWKTLQRSLFDETADADEAPALAVAPAALPDTPRPLPPILAGEVFRHPRAQRDARLDGHLVAYELRRARRRSIGFIVGAEGLTVSAPRWVGARELDSALQEKRGWILKKLREQRERAARLQSSRIDWRDGAALPFLGETVVVVLDARATGAVLDATAAEGLPGVPSRLLRLGLPHTATPEQIRDAVHGWLQRQARRVFEERCAVYAVRLGVCVRRSSPSASRSSRGAWGAPRVAGRSPRRAPAGAAAPTTGRSA
jgi:predicted metal-dependent hydrolase